MKKAVIAALALNQAVEAGKTIELSSADLSNAGGRAYDNIVAKWSETLKVFGREANIATEYDRNAKKDFLKEVTVSGQVDDVSYEVTNNFGGDTSLTLTANTKDGTTVEVAADDKAGLTSITASRKGVRAFDRDVDVEASHDTQAASSKLKLSSVLGHGVTAIATANVANGGATTTNVDLEYENELTNGRTVSAKVNPKAGSGEVEYVDSKTIDATITASMDLGGKPKVTVKRAWAF
jgi:hypothetical protein